MKVTHQIALMPALAVAALLLVFVVVQLTRAANEGLNRRIETGYMPAVTTSQDLVATLAREIRGRRFEGKFLVKPRFVQRDTTETPKPGGATALG